MKFYFKIFFMLFLIVFINSFIISDEYKITEKDFIGIWKSCSNLSVEDMNNKSILSNPNLTKMYLVIDKLNDYFIIFLIDYKENPPVNNHLVLGIFDNNKKQIKFIEEHTFSGNIYLKEENREIILSYDYDFPPGAVFHFVKMTDNDLKLFKNEIEKLKELMK